MFISPMGLMRAPRPQGFIKGARSPGASGSLWTQAVGDVRLRPDGKAECDHEGLETEKGKPNLSDVKIFSSVPTLISSARPGLFAASGFLVHGAERAFDAAW